MRKLSALALSGMLLFSAAPVMAAPAAGMGAPVKDQAVVSVENVAGMGSALVREEKAASAVDQQIVGMAKTGREDNKKAAEELAASILSQKTVKMQGAGMARSLR